MLFFPLCFFVLFFFFALNIRTIVLTLLYTLNVSADMSFGLLRVSHVEIGSPRMVNGIRTVYPCGLDKEFSSKFDRKHLKKAKGYIDQNFEYDIEDEDNNSNILSDLSIFITEI